MEMCCETVIPRSYGYCNAGIHPYFNVKGIFAGNEEVFDDEV